jgi:hypothetical protein
MGVAWRKVRWQWEHWKSSLLNTKERKIKNNVKRNRCWKTQSKMFVELRETNENSPGGLERANFVPLLAKAHWPATA